MKTLWIDTETTGLVPKFHEVVEIGLLVENNGTIVDELEIRIRPMHPERTDPGALRVNGLSPDMMETWPYPVMAYSKLVDLFAKHLAPYEAFRPAGFNVGFDIDMLDGLLDEFKDTAIRSRLQKRRVVDPLPVARFLEWAGVIRTDNLRLSTLCEELGVPLDHAHSALSDIRATRKLAGVMADKLRAGVPFIERNTLVPDEVDVSVLDKMREEFHGPHT